MTEKTHVKVFITKTNKFRARITKEKKSGLIPSKTVRAQVNEVSIGGESWAMGKGHGELPLIKDRIERLLFSLIADYIICVLDLNREEMAKAHSITFHFDTGNITTGGKNVR